jgi:hypothetical protein
MLAHISARAIEQTFVRYGFSVRQIADGLIIRFPYPSTRYMWLDTSEGYMFWDDLEYWANEAGLDRELFEE